MANAAQKTKAQAKLSAAVAKKTAPVEVPTTEAPVKEAPVAKPASIRGTIMQMVRENRQNKEIVEILKERFPGTAAAAKASKHIAFYRSRMRKQAQVDAAQAAEKARSGI